MTASRIGLTFILLISILGQAEAGGPGTGEPVSQDKILLTGKVESLHKEPIAEATIRVFVGGQEQPIMQKEADPSRGLAPVFAPGNKIETSSDGDYTAIIFLPAHTARSAEIRLLFEKPSYKDKEIPITNLTADDEKSGEYIHYEIITPERKIGAAFYISAFVLLMIYALITFDVFHRTLVAFLGASALLFISYIVGHYNSDYFILSFENAKDYIDFNVIFLLMGMMIIVGVMKRTGVFQWLAYKSYQLAKGDIWRLSVFLSVITAIVSAFLDNVTTMLLIAPVSMEIALVLRISPWSLLLPEVLASNFGGTATLIGDPPNIMIGSYAHLTFLDFIPTMTPVVILSMVALIIMMKFRYGPEYHKAKLTTGEIVALLNRLKDEYKITNLTLLRHSLILLAIVIFMFIIHGIFNMEPSIPALAGAALLMISAVVVDKVNIAHLIEKEIEWTTLVFFIMLFIVVGAAVETGLIQMVAEWISGLSHGNLTLAILLVLWVSAFASALVDNIPFTATMLPIVGYLSQVVPHAEANILYWALALGACFGGNGTLIGASANVVTAGLAEKEGHPITFIGYLKFGMPVMIVSVIISSLWLLFVLANVHG